MISIELKETKTVETETAHISLINNSIIRLAVKDNAHLQCENLEKNYEVYHNMLKGNPAPFLIIVNDSATISTEGREEFNQKGMRDLRKADALIIHNPSTMLLINAQVKFVKPLIPMQAFINEHEGAAWLNRFL